MCTIANDGNPHQQELAHEQPRPDHQEETPGHGDGGIRQRSDGRWEATIDLGFADGKRKRKFLYGSTRREVAQKLDKARRSVQQGLNLTAKRQTVGGWLDYWIEEIIKPEREATTYAAYETFSRLHIKPYLGQIAIDRLQPEELERWLRELDRRGVGVRTRQCCLSRLRTALTLAMRRGYVVRNVAELVDPPASIRKKHQAPRMDDLKRLLDATREDRLHAMILVALGLGLRRGEVLGLKWEDIDLEGRRLTVRRHVVRTKQTGRAVLEGAKTDAGERTVMLPQLLVSALRRHQAGQVQDRQLAGARWVGPDYVEGKAEGFVFTSTVGTGMEPRRVNVYFSEACERAGIPAHTFHGLRHDFGSLLLAAGVPTRVVQEMLGHANPYITMGRYQHVPDELQRDAADRLDVVLNFAS